MKQYFYLLHPHLPQQVTFQVPLIINADNLEIAKSVAEELRRMFAKIFDFVISPSSPVLNDASDAIVPPEMFFSMLEDGKNRGESISIELPSDFDCDVHQFNGRQEAHNLSGLVILGGQYEKTYSLQG